MVVGKIKARNLPKGYDSSRRTSGTTVGAGERKLKKTLRALQSYQQYFKIQSRKDN